MYSATYSRMVRLWVVLVVVGWALVVVPNDQRQSSMVLGFDTSHVQFRPGTPSDEWPITLQLAKELMNPLGVVLNKNVSRRFLVAYTAEQPRIGWAQIRPLSSTSSREDAIQKETDEALWDDWEADDRIQVPVGLQSLPWTREYREFSQQARQQQQQNRRATLLRETAREQPPVLYELASVWVAPSFRHQGIGTELVRRTLQRHCRRRHNLATNIYLLTLASTAAWYRENFGFRLVTSVEDIPASMALEVQVGKLITGWIGAELVCMQGTEATGRL